MKELVDEVKVLKILRERGNVVFDFFYNYSKLYFRVNRFWDGDCV